MKKLLLAGVSLVVALALPPVANASTTINFADYNGQNLSSADGVTFTLSGGPGSGGIPCVCSFGDSEIGNSTTGEYPTSEQLIFTFSSAAGGISFYYDNFGSAEPGEGRGASFFDAYGSSNNLISTGFIGDVSEGGAVIVPGSGIKSLVLDNGSGGFSSWEFGVASLTYAAAPEPASLALLGVGLAGIGVLHRRKRKVV